VDKPAEHIRKLQREIEPIRRVQNQPGASPGEQAEVEIKPVL